LERPKKVLSAFCRRPASGASLFVGPSGVGKSTMALALAAELHAELHKIPSQKCKAPGRSSPNAHNHYFVASKRAIGIWCCSHAALVSHSNKPPSGPVSDPYGLVPARADARFFSLTREGPE
jgi:DNA polymerase III delta prime subunit